MKDTTFRNIALFLSVVEGLKTYQVQDTTSFVEHLIQQVLLREDRLVPNTVLRDRKTLRNRKSLIFGNKLRQNRITNRTMIPVGCGLTPAVRLAG